MTSQTAIAYLSGKPTNIDLVSIGGKHALHRPAAVAFLAMAIEAKKAGIVLVVNSSFRDMAAQKAEWNLRQAALKEGRPYKKVADPGYSTHQSGVSVDINRAHDDFTNNGKADGKTDTWLQVNAPRFGFVNDVKSEPWHWTHMPSLVALRASAKA